MSLRNDLYSDLNAVLSPSDRDRVWAQIGKRFAAPVYVEDPFTYVMEFLPATLSATVTVQSNVQNDSAFVIVKTSAIVSDTSDAYVANLSGSIEDLRPFLFTFQDTGSGRLFSDSGVHLDNMFGTAGRPFVWPRPKLIKAGSTMVGKCQNLSATSRNVRCAFHGFKVFGDVDSWMLRQGRNI